MTAFSLQNNLCEFSTQEHKFQGRFCTKKTVLNIHSRDF